MTILQDLINELEGNPQGQADVREALALIKRQQSQLPELPAPELDPENDTALVFDASAGGNKRTPVGSAVAMTNDTGGSTLRTAATMTNSTGGSTLRTAAAQDVEAWRSTVTVTGNHTVASPPAYGTSVVNCNMATGTITILDDVPEGGRILVRKINSTQGSVSIDRSGTDTITRAALTEVTLNADGDNWLLEKVSATRWELIAGVESGENSDGEYWRYADGTQSAKGAKSYNDVVVDEAVGSIRTNNASLNFDFPVPFISSPGLSPALLRPSGAAFDIWLLLNSRSSSGFSFRVGRSVERAADDYTVINIATGRWYE